MEKIFEEKQYHGDVTFFKRMVTKLNDNVFIDMGGGTTPVHLQITDNLAISNPSWIGSQDWQSVKSFYKPNAWQALDVVIGFFDQNNVLDYAKPAITEMIQLLYFVNDPSGVQAEELVSLLCRYQDTSDMTTIATAHAVKAEVSLNNSGTQSTALTGVLSQLIITATGTVSKWFGFRATQNQWLGGTNKVTDGYSFYSERLRDVSIILRRRRYRDR
jgi:hypothetical protein